MSSKPRHSPPAPLPTLEEGASHRDHPNERQHDMFVAAITVVGPSDKENGTKVPNFGDTALGTTIMSYLPQQLRTTLTQVSRQGKCVKHIAW